MVDEWKGMKKVTLVVFLKTFAWVVEPRNVGAMEFYEVVDFSGNM